MKRKIYHPSPSEAELKGPSYWRSIDDLNGSKEFQQWVDQEFTEGAAELNDTDRRDFLKIMAASFGLAGVGMTGCRVPERRVYPYTHQPEYVIPGVATYYSTSHAILGMSISRSSLRLIRLDPPRLKVTQVSSQMGEAQIFLRKLVFLDFTILTVLEDIAILPGNSFHAKTLFRLSRTNLLHTPMTRVKVLQFCWNHLAHQRVLDSFPKSVLKSPTSLLSNILQ